MNEYKYWPAILAAAPALQTPSQPTNEWSRTDALIVFRTSEFWTWLKACAYCLIQAQGTARQRLEPEDLLQALWTPAETVGVRLSFEYRLNDKIELIKLPKKQRLKLTLDPSLSERLPRPRTSWDKLFDCQNEQTPNDKQVKAFFRMQLKWRLEQLGESRGSASSRASLSPELLAQVPAETAHTTCELEPSSAPKCAMTVFDKAALAGWPVERVTIFATIMEHHGEPDDSPDARERGRWVQPYCDALCKAGLLPNRGKKSRGQAQAWGMTILDWLQDAIDCLVDEVYPTIPLNLLPIQRTTISLLVQGVDHDL